MVMWVLWFHPQPLNLIPQLRHSGAFHKLRCVFISCDECYKEFLTPEDAKENKGLNTLTFNDDSIDIEEAIKKGWAKYIYVFEKGKWLSYLNKNKDIYADYPEIENIFQLMSLSKT